MKLTPELIEEAAQLIRAGNYNETVCRYLGIDPSTFYRWLREGEQEESGLKNQFYHAIKRAEAHAEIRNVQIIQRAAAEAENDPRLWTAAMAFLERKHPDRWGRREKVSADVEHKGQVTNRHEYDITTRIEQYEDVYSKLADRGKVESSYEGDHS